MIRNLSLNFILILSILQDHFGPPFNYKNLIVHYFKILTNFKICINFKIPKCYFDDSSM